MSTILCNTTGNFNNLVFNRYYILTNSLIYNVIVNKKTYNGKTIKKIKKVNNLLP